MPNPYLGQIQAFGFNFAPRNWALCNGQLLPLAQNTALFSLLGTIYGGDGRTTFALPDLQGRASFKYGRGPGLSDYRIGQKSGQEDVTLTSLELASHKHRALGSDKDADSTSPKSATLATTVTPIYNSTVDAPMKSTMIGNTGGGQSHNNMQPYLVLNWCICLQGEYPSRS